MTAVKFSICHGVGEVDHFETLDHALADAAYRFDTGDESLLGFMWADAEGARHEAFGDAAVALMRNRKQPKNKRAKPLPIVGVLKVRCPDLGWFTYSEFTNQEALDKVRGLFASAVGPDNVKVTKRR